MFLSVRAKSLGFLRQLCVAFLLCCSLISFAQTEEIKVMTFNIWVGGTRVDFNQIIKAVQVADADIVGIQESSGNLARLADALGFYYDTNNQIISRFPIVDQLHRGVLLDLGNGRRVAHYNVHLTPYPYGPYDLRDGKSVNQVLAAEQSGHMAEMAGLFSELRTRVAAGTICFLTGDFNVPSHLDWGPEAAYRNFGKTVAWPVSVELAQIGLHDAYREANPDVVNRPGETWTAGYPAPHVEPNEKHDRIDFVYFSGPQVVLTDAAVLGHDPANPNTDIAVTPWGSDHRAVVATFNIPVTGTAAEVAPSKASYLPGESIQVNFSGAAGIRTDWVGLFDADTATGPGRSLGWLYTDGTKTGTAGITSGTLHFAGLAEGDYQARLFFNDSYAEEAVADFSVAPAQPAGIRLDRRAYAPGMAITASYAGGSGSNRDWIDLTRANGSRLLWSYIPSTATSGQVSFSAGLSEQGSFLAHFYCCDGFNQIGGTQSFAVTTAPRVDSALDSYAVNAPIEIQFLNGSGDTRDWVGLYQVGKTDRKFLTWQYTGGARQGALSFSGLPAGDYEARFFFRNSYTREAVTAFTVR